VDDLGQKPQRDVADLDQRALLHRHAARRACAVDERSVATSEVTDKPAGVRLANLGVLS
jgi:hypothetical protein